MYRLQYDSSTNTYHNESRVEIIVPNFGDVDSVTYVGGHPQYPYFYKMVNYLRNEHGYTDLNLKAAPYDWRLAPSKDHWVIKDSLMHDCDLYNIHRKQIVLKKL